MNKAHINDIQDKVRKLVESETDIDVSKIESVPRIALLFILGDMRDKKDKIQNHKCVFKRGEVKVTTTPSDDYFLITLYFNEKLIEESKLKYSTIKKLENIIKDYI